MLCSMLRNAIFGVLTVSALGFGGTQAFAAPQGTGAARACTPTYDVYCNDECQFKGYDGGYCSTGSTCRCYYN